VPFPDLGTGRALSRYIQQIFQQTSKC